MLVDFRKNIYYGSKFFPESLPKHHKPIRFIKNTLVSNNLSSCCVSKHTYFYEAISCKPFIFMIIFWTYSAFYLLFSISFVDACAKVNWSKRATFEGSRLKLERILSSHEVSGQRRLEVKREKEAPIWLEEHGV